MHIFSGLNKPELFLNVCSQLPECWVFIPRSAHMWSHSSFPFPSAAVTSAGPGCPAQHKGPIWVFTRELQQCSEFREMHIVLKPPFVHGCLKAVQIWY